MLKCKEKQNRGEHRERAICWGDILKDNKSNKTLKIGTNIVLILLIIGAIQMFYDEDSTNDHFGWFFFCDLLGN